MKWLCKCRLRTLNRYIFWPFLVFQKWPRAHKSGHLAGFWAKIGEKYIKIVKKLNKNFGQKWLKTGVFEGFGHFFWPFGHFYFESGQAETVAAQGFAGFLATFPLFSLTFI